MYVSASDFHVPSQSIDTVFNVTNSGFTSYAFSGAISGSNPTLTLIRGLIYTFNVSASGHPFWIKSGSITIRN